MSDDIPSQVEVWKKIVEVQQHFNDLELRIRNFTLVLTGAFIGLGGYTIKDGGSVMLFGVRISVAGLVVCSSLLPLLAFYLMDRLWYHRLLFGAVSAGYPVEGRLRDLGLKIDLVGEISRASPFQFFGRAVHSKHKMDGFYGILALGILALSLILGFGVTPVPSPAAPRAQVAAPTAPHVQVPSPAAPHAQVPAVSRAGTEQSRDNSTGPKTGPQATGPHPHQ